MKQNKSAFHVNVDGFCFVIIIQLLCLSCLGSGTQYLLTVVQRSPVDTVSFDTQPLYQEFQGLQLEGYGPPPMTSQQVLDNFRSALFALINQPGNMEELMRGVIEEIYLLPPTEPSIENQVVDLLFEQVLATEEFLSSRKQF